MAEREKTPPRLEPAWTDTERLAALDRYGVLDTPREAQFDDVVRLVADIFEAPISVVNLIADRRQWFKAEVGIGVDELPLNVSICAHAILQPGIFVVPDTTQDSRFDRNPLVTGDPGLRFYAGALLETREGLPLGTLCVLDTKPRPAGITDRQRLALEVLARQVMTQLELRRAVAEQDQRADRLETESLRAAASERALAESEERLRLAVDHAEIGFWDVESGHAALIWPPRTKAMFGISPDVPVTMQDFYDGLHPEDREATSAIYAAAADPERRALYDVEYRTVGKEDGIVRWVAAKGRGVFDDSGRCLRVVGTAIDITERKRVEAELRTSEARLRTLNADLETQVVERASERALLWQMSPDLLSVIDLPTASFDRVNPAWALALGWTDEEMDGRPFASLVHSEDVEASQGAFGKVLAGNPVLRFENRYRTKAGRWRWLSWVAVPGGGKLYSTTRDVTDEKAQAEALAIATAERDRMWQMSPDLLVVIGFDGVLRRLNPAWTAVLGYDEAELLGTRIDRLVHPDDVELTERALLQASGGPLSTVENRWLHKDGSYRWISWITPAPEGGLIYATGRHVTFEKKREAELEAAQEALRQSQKMEAVGQLTGGLAHDFNNLLTAIGGSLQLMRNRIEQGRPAEVERYHASAQAAVKRAAALTHRLLAFSRRQTLDPKPVDVNRLLAGMEELIRRTVGPAVALEVVGAGGLWPTLVDANQLENALLNLCINARDAMPDGGKITIETANQWIDDRSARTLDLTPGQYLSVCVTDTGTGMSTDVQAKAFDPFFTTKPLGLGTGLGLSMTYGFARQSGGHVRIDSEMGRGTTMCLYLPRYAGEAPHVEGLSLVAPVGDAPRGATVLIVDDEPTIRMLIADVLSEAGYVTLEGEDGKTGLAALNTKDRIDLLITDVGLPGGMNGRQLADAARESRPELRVLFITGFAETVVVGNGNLEAGMAILTKPFDIRSLSGKVADLLQEQRSDPKPTFDGAADGHDRW